MTKQDIVATVADACGVNRQTTQLVIEEAGRAIIDAMTSGEPVFLRGFGTFRPFLRKTKKARNITKGEAMVVPAHYIAKYIPSKEVRAKMVNINVNEHE